MRTYIVALLHHNVYASLRVGDAAAYNRRPLFGVPDKGLGGLDTELSFLLIIGLLHRCGPF